MAISQPDRVELFHEGQRVLTRCAEHVSNLCDRNFAVRSKLLGDAISHFDVSLSLKYHALPHFDQLSALDQPLQQLSPDGISAFLQGRRPVRTVGKAVHEGFNTSRLIRRICDLKTRQAHSISNSVNDASFGEGFQ